MIEVTTVCMQCCFNINKKERREQYYTMQSALIIKKEHNVAYNTNFAGSYTEKHCLPLLINSPVTLKERSTQMTSLPCLVEMVS